MRSAERPHPRPVKPCKRKSQSLPNPQDPVAAADADARSLARQILANASHAALGVIDPETGGPAVSRIALGLTPQGIPVSLISALAPHTGALRANPAASLLVGEPGPRGDPLIHPRLMIRATARFIAPDDPSLVSLRAHYLSTHPKAKLYAGFADFSFVVFTPISALLNGGFGRAFRLTPDDLA